MIHENYTKAAMKRGGFEIGWIVLYLVVAILACQAKGEQDIPKLWARITNLNGCLVGSQDYQKEDVGEGSILAGDLCREMIQGNRKRIGVFLATRMGSLQETRVHARPRSYRWRRAGRPSAGKRAESTLVRRARVPSDRQG